MKTIKLLFLAAIAAIGLTACTPGATTPARAAAPASQSPLQQAQTGIGQFSQLSNLLGGSSSGGTHGSSTAPGGNPSGNPSGSVPSTPAAPVDGEAEKPKCDDPNGGGNDDPNGGATGGNDDLGGASDHELE